MDTNSAILWNYVPTVGYEHADVTDIIKTADGNFVCVGHSEYCDVFGGITFAVKIDSNGTNIWTKIYQFVSFYNSDQHIAELPGGNIALAIDNNLIFLNSLGDSLTTVTIPVVEIEDIVLTPDNYLLLGCNGSIVKTDLNGVAVSSATMVNYCLIIFFTVE